MKFAAAHVEDEADLEDLDARAEQISREMGHQSESASDDSGQSEAESDYDDDLGRHAATRKRTDRTGQGAPHAGSTPKKPRIESKRDAEAFLEYEQIPAPPTQACPSEEELDLNDEEDDQILRQSTWRDLEKARDALTTEHQEGLREILDKWTGLDGIEGDVVDLQTGRIVNNQGHLETLRVPRQGFNMFAVDVDSDNSDSEVSASNEGSGNGDVDPLLSVIERRSELMDQIVRDTGKGWII